MLREFLCVKLEGEKAEMSIHKVAEEAPLSIFINGRHFVTAMTSPDARREFIIGHLFSERIVRGYSEIESLEIEGNVARAIIANPVKAIMPRRPIVSGCGGISSFLDESKLSLIESDLKIEREDIHKAMKAISSSGLHKASGGVHSVGLFDRGEKICIFDDIGRHNALDKAIGYSLMNGLNFRNVFAVSTGRISSDMALKCSAAKIPLIASRGATTSLAIAIAERTGLTVVGFVRGARMNIYTNFQRFADLSFEEGDARKA
jgi:FdhD protein